MLRILTSAPTWWIWKKICVTIMWEVCKWKVGFLKIWVHMPNGLCFVEVKVWYTSAKIIWNILYAYKIHGESCFLIMSKNVWNRKKTKDDTCKVETLSIIIIYSMISTIFLCYLLDLNVMLMCEEVTIHECHLNCVYHKLIFNESTQHK
jgi:hypothetical protein